MALIVGNASRVARGFDADVVCVAPISSMTSSTSAFHPLL